MIVSTTLLCLALNIFHEARGEQVPGQYAVAQVTLNRASQNGSTPCEETFKPKQFSWTVGVKKVRGGWLIPDRLKPSNQYAWNKALIIAGVVTTKKVMDFSRGADHYHADYVKPRWASKMQQVFVIGRHIFYVRNE